MGGWPEDPLVKINDFSRYLASSSLALSWSMPSHLTVKILWLGCSLVMCDVWMRSCLCAL